MRILDLCSTGRIDDFYAGCLTYTSFVEQLTLELSSFLLFCIALNLQLVVVHGVNGQRMEKFYLIISALLTIVLVVPPYAAGQYGWDPLEKDCWYTNDNRHERIIWQVTTQMAWTALTVIGEVICSTVVLVFMLQHNSRTRRIFASTRSFSHASSAPQVLHANRYKSIILRVALYPLASCCVNLLSVATALHSTLSNGIQDRTDYNVLLLSDFLYGGRAIVYALLAATDPALVRGVRALYSQMFGKHGITTSSDKTGETGSSGHGSHFHRPTQVFIELSTITSPASPEAIDKPATRNAPGEVVSDVLGDDKKNDSPSDPNASYLELGIAGPVEASSGLEFGEQTRRTRIRAEELQRRRSETQRKDREGQEAFRKQI
ncbi:hypothetical protein VNI00_008534 [Paramarasmius palmivorus]|uniref:G-protein coupled receptors family 2 profile 2 domain-containing protein n=1 Tax=Paramarasmius palmivorus TaxID=297713 RepID=A0AAW0CVP7_9AGAR